MLRQFISVALQYLANRLPNLENKLADAKPTRVLARTVVRFIHNLKYYAEKDAQMVNPNKLMYSARRLSSEFTRTFKDSKEYFKSGKEFFKKR